ncbi:MAG: hypothetical protein FJ106_06305 [Deltaproteobacteria bacterium]|nr:hypothetical protein [Deltaproteobacteria bacterium]MBM4349484.1 hypothetical protein [Deltaproteobacteria bacterium]
MVRKPYVLYSLCLLLLSLLLWGCPKKIVKLPPVEGPLVKDPIARFLEDFSSAESLQARASIRLDTERKGEEMRFLLNGLILYQKPDKFRILGYHPFGTGVFDALYRGGEFFLLSPLQNKAYTGEVSEYRDLIEKTDVRIFTEQAEGSQIPNRIRIELPEKRTRLDLRLKEISLNSSLPKDSFQWIVPEGVEVIPLSQFLKGKKL